MFHQRGSLMLDVVVALALASIILMLVSSQISAVMYMSRREDARVQGMMAARIKMEEIRSCTPITPGQGWWVPEGFDTLGESGYLIEQAGPGLFRVVITVRDRQGAEVYSTESMVRQK